MKISIPIQIVMGLIGLSLIAYLGVLTWNAYTAHDTIGRPPDVRDTISIEGEGTITSRPDIARLNVGVISEGQEVKTAQDENTKQVNDIIKALSALGIADEDIQTSNYQVFPQYNYREGEQELRGYRVSQSLSIKIRDLEKIGDVLAKAGELGSNEIHGISFDLDDPSALEADARTKAIVDAKTKADVLADTLGVKIVRVVGFYEQGGNVPPEPFLRAYAEDAKAMGMGGAAPEVKPGSFDVTKNVTVMFEIR
ncbi:DUF541 domain-containing protein [Candidatus Uhrbacteria bacterium]|nr:DUF541 domain-containing protein [Candidatus Uhrbacteria bacterium]MBD3283962.1 DUF541 domain-containing protein [Candidatus Uhrbacteria bacterium]